MLSELSEKTLKFHSFTHLHVIIDSLLNCVFLLEFLCKRENITHKSCVSELSAMWNKQSSGYWKGHHRRQFFKKTMLITQTNTSRWGGKHRTHLKEEIHWRHFQILKQCAQVSQWGGEQKINPFEIWSPFTVSWRSSGCNEIQLKICVTWFNQNELSTTVWRRLGRNELQHR